MLFLRTAGSSTIGLGHIFRSIAVASSLRDLADVNPLFVLNDDSQAKSLIEKNGFSSVTVDGALASTEFIGGLVKSCSNGSHPTCYVDMKTDVSEEIRSWKKFDTRVILMDNLTPAHELADLTVLPVPYAHPSASHSGEKRIVSGREWIPVAARFAQERLRLPAFGERNSVLVTMGGADPNRLTLKVMSALATVKGVSIKVVLGFAMKFKEEARRLGKLLGPQSEIIENTDHIELLMREAGLAITAVGTTIYELAALGVPTVILSNYTADRADEVALGMLGWIVPLGYHLNVSELEIERTVRTLWKDAGKRESMSSAALSTIDGNGAERIARELIKFIS
jgi:spore coat polysaccharide biosynthesis protein SpsF